MTAQQKEQIQWRLNNYVNSFRSQTQAANSLKNCSEATIINILKGKWENISDDMWRLIDSQINPKTSTTKLVETMNFMTMILYFSIAKENGATFAISGGAGYGKTYTGNYFSQANRDKNVYYVGCAEYWNKKTFLTSIFQAMGRSSAGMNVIEMMQSLIQELRRQHEPLIILDEIDKLSDTVLKFFITLYNELDGSCGFVWTSTNNMEKRMIKGLNSNKNGYQELFSRIGQRFISLPPASTDEIKELCRINGITKEEDIAKIVNECDGDLRRVKRNFLKYKAIERRKNLKVA